MSARNPRIHAVLEPPLYKAVEYLAEKRGVSLSQEVCDLVRNALELLEDAGLERFADERRKTFRRKKALSVEEIHERLKLG